MANWSILKKALSDIIKSNGNREITGDKLQSALNNMVTNLGNYASCAGIATPSTSPGTPDGPIFYFALTPGTYVNFGSMEIYDGLSIITNVNGPWQSYLLMEKSSEGGSTGNIDFDALALRVKALEDKLAKPDGIATLNSGGRLNTAQIPRTSVLAKNFASIDTSPLIIVNAGKYSGSTVGATIEIVFASTHGTFVQKITRRVGEAPIYYADWTGSTEFSTIATNKGVKPVPGKIYKASNTETLYVASNSNALLPIQANPVLALGENDDEAFPGDRGVNIEKKVDGTILEFGWLRDDYASPVLNAGFMPLGTSYKVCFDTTYSRFVAVENTGNTDDPNYYLEWPEYETYGVIIDSNVRPVSGKLYYDSKNIYVLDNTKVTSKYKLKLISSLDFSELMRISESVVSFLTFVEIPANSIVNTSFDGELHYNITTKTFVTENPNKSGEYGSMNTSKNETYVSTLNMESTNAGYKPTPGLLYFAKDENIFYIADENGAIVDLSNSSLQKEAFIDFWINTIGGKYNRDNDEFIYKELYTGSQKYVISLTYEEARKSAYARVKGGNLNGTAQNCGKLYLPPLNYTNPFYSNATQIFGWHNVEYLFLGRDFGSFANMPTNGTANPILQNVNKLKIIIGRLNYNVNIANFTANLNGAPNLEAIRFSVLPASIDAKDCPKLNLQTLTWMVEDRSTQDNKVESTVILHPNAYALLTPELLEKAETYKVQFVVE